MKSNNKFIIQILGPTGIGKSKIAITLAEKFQGEIISADSSQVYRDFNIGTDKITAGESGGIRHHLIDIFTDCAQFNAYIFLNKAYKVALDLEKRGKLPIICGGTALYHKIMITGVFPEKKAKLFSREKINQMVKQKGLEFYWQELNSIDPEYAGKIGKNDRIRITRAMEIYLNNNCAPSELFKKNKTPFKDHRFLRIGIDMERGLLYKRIEERVDKMIQAGLLAEVEDLLRKYPPRCPPFKSIGYKEMIRYLNNEIGYPEAIELIKKNSRNLAKRQLSWLRQEKDILWFSIGQKDEILALVENKLA